MLSSDNVPVNLDAGRNGSPMLKVTDRWIRTSGRSTRSFSMLGGHLFLGFDASLKVHLTDRSECLVNDDAPQLNMKILGNFLKVTLYVSFGMEPNALLLRHKHEI